MRGVEESDRVGMNWAYCKEWEKDTDQQSMMIGVDDTLVGGERLFYYEYHYHCTSSEDFLTGGWCNCAAVG